MPELNFAAMAAACRNDPLLLKHILWPDDRFYDKQIEIIESSYHNHITVVPAGNQLGKDFVLGYIALSNAIVHHPFRIVTTSATDRHLNVLWGEIDGWISRSKFPLLAKQGGILSYNHHDIKKVVGGAVDKQSYLIGAVATSGSSGEGLGGHHSRYTLAIIDEASGVDDVAFEHMQGWAKRFVIVGNPWDCNNFFKKLIKRGDIRAA